MAKIVRLNDKFWFGKYSGHTFKEILSMDKAYVDSLMFKNKIIYHENILNYLDKRNSDREKKSSNRWMSTSWNNSDSFWGELTVIEIRTSTSNETSETGESTAD